MSYTEEDARWDEAWESMSKELYPEHKKQAIDEFTKERLQSFYLQNPEILIPGINAYKEAKKLLEHSPSAALIFFTSAIEICLKASILKPIVYGLVHNEKLAEAIVESALGQSGFDRYKALISKIYTELVGLDINEFKRAGSQVSLLKEAEEIQKVRNKIIHRGELASLSQAEKAKAVAASVLDEYLTQVLSSISLVVQPNGHVSNPFQA